MQLYFFLLVQVLGLIYVQVVELGMRMRDWVVHLVSLSNCSFVVSPCHIVERVCVTHMECMSLHCVCNFCMFSSLSFFSILPIGFC